MQLHGTQKQIKWAESIRRGRLAQWSRSELYPDMEADILQHIDATWWIANRNRSIEEMCSKMKVLVDFESWTRTDTETGCMWIGPTRDAVTGEVVADDGTLPF